MSYASCASSVAAAIRVRSFQSMRWRRSRELVFVPYIFSREEVVALIEAATGMRTSSHWGAMLRALCLVLYCTGMRQRGREAVHRRCRSASACSDGSM